MRFSDRTVRCEDIPCPGGCCSSCHEDEAMGYDHMLEIEDEQGRVMGWVCCTRYNALDDVLCAKLGIAR